MIVARFTFFTENLVISSYQVTKIFRSGHDCTSTSSARGPCYFRLQADITISVLRKVRMCIVLTRTGFHVCSRLHGRSMRRTGSASGLSEAFLKYFHRPNSPCCSQSSNSCEKSLCTSFETLFSVCFSVSVDSCNGSLRSSSFVLPLLSDTGVSTPLFSDTESLFADVDSCDEDGDGADEGAVEEELADIPRTTHNSQSAFFLHFLFFLGSSLSSTFYLVVHQPCNEETNTCLLTYNPFHFCRIGTRVGANIHKAFA